MSKPITCVAALMLYDEGRFQLDDPVSRFVPAFKDMQVAAERSAKDFQLVPLEREMTIRQLFTHTGGLNYGRDEARDALGALYRRVNVWGAGTLAEFVQRLAMLPLPRQPGSAWVYSVSMDVLGYLVEAISGMPFDAFLQERLFAPLGMTDTGFGAPAKKRARRAQLYGHDKTGALKRWSGSLPRFPSGGGGLYSTAADYLRFAQMLLNGGELDGARILRPETVKLMTTNHLPAAMLPFIPPTWPFRLGYGMGLGVRVIVNLAETGEPGSVGSFTWQGAAGTDFWVDPQEAIIGLSLPQIMPGQYDAAKEFRALAYQALLE
jgi:CubicO group peptidase (beta-lactamase class C family)